MCRMKGREKNLKTTMKQMTASAPEKTGETAAASAPPQLGIRIVEEPPSPAPSPADLASAGATARQAAPEAVPPPANPCSVVAKVAKLLIHRGHDLPREQTIQWEDGFVQRKVLMSLHAKQPL
jgi:hypothetical protein